MKIAGVDGCKGGWVVASREGHGEVTISVRANFKEVLADPHDLIAVDIPIGLVDGRRPCDEEARQALGARQMCVFYAPLRSAVAADDYEHAKRICTDLGVSKLSIQCWCIVPKILDVDEAIGPADQERVYEVHPEVTFCAMNGGAPLMEKKSSPAGKEMRRKLIEAAMGFDPVGFTVRGIKPSRVAVDDIYDAFAALWSAERIARGDARPLPLEPCLDTRGLRMAIWV